MNKGKSVNHYSNNGQSIDVREFMRMQGIDSFNIGNALKYLVRAGKKKGESGNKDLLKALNYIHEELTHEWIDIEVIKAKIK